MGDEHGKIQRQGQGRRRNPLGQRNSRHELHLAIAQTLIDGGEIMLPEAPKPDIPTVREFVEQVYYKTYIEPLAPKTVDNYSQYLKLNILPFLGDMRLDEVNVSTIQQFYNWMATAAERGRLKNLNARTIQRVSGFTSRIFKVAMEMGLIEDTPFKNTLLTIRAEEAGHHKPLSDEEICRVKRDIPTLPILRDRVYMGLLAYTGMRLEEILGLQWDTVDLEGRYCTITQTSPFPKTCSPWSDRAAKRNIPAAPSSCRMPWWRS